LKDLNIPPTAYRPVAYGLLFAEAGALAAWGNHRESPIFLVFLPASRQGRSVAVGRNELRRRQVLSFACFIGKPRQNLNSFQPESGKAKLENGNWPSERSQYS
jgi:hypothetical protein